MIGMENRKAYILGYKACEEFLKDGVVRHNPYKKGTSVYEHWRRGYNECYNGE